MDFSKVAKVAKAIKTHNEDQTRIAAQKRVAQFHDYGFKAKLEGRKLNDHFYEEQKKAEKEYRQIVEQQRRDRMLEEMERRRRECDYESDG